MKTFNIAELNSINSSKIFYSFIDKQQNHFIIRDKRGGTRYIFETLEELLTSITRDDTKYTHGSIRCIKPIKILCTFDTFEELQMSYPEYFI